MVGGNDTVKRWAITMITQSLQVGMQAGNILLGGGPLDFWGGGEKYNLGRQTGYCEGMAY